MVTNALDSWCRLIPDVLIEAFRDDVPPTLFLGSGLGKEAVPPIATGVELADELRKELGVTDNGIALPELLQFYKNSQVGTTRSVQQWLEAKLKHNGTNSAEPGGAYYLLLQLPSRRVLTTNYDLLLDRAASHVLSPGDWLRTADSKKFADYIQTSGRSTKVCGAVHGYFGPNGSERIVATTDDYASEFVNPKWQKHIYDAVRKERIVFIGYSLRDFTTWSSYISSTLRHRSTVWPKYLVTPYGTSHDEAFWSRYNVAYIPLKAYQFLIALHHRLDTLTLQKNHYFAAAACWNITPEAAESRFIEEHKRRRYPDVAYTMRAIINEIHGTHH